MVAERARDGEHPVHALVEDHAARLDDPPGLDRVRRLVVGEGGEPYSNAAAATENCTRLCLS